MVLFHPDLTGFVILVSTLRSTFLVANGLAHHFSGLLRVDPVKVGTG